MIFTVPKSKMSGLSYTDDCMILAA